MNSEQFAYWLNGFFEIENPKSLDERKTQIIKDHLSLLFNKITPSRVLKEDMTTPVVEGWPSWAIDEWLRANPPTGHPEIIESNTPDSSPRKYC